MPELSIIASSPDPAAEIKPMLDEFEAQQHIHVNVCDGVKHGSE